MGKGKRSFLNDGDEHVGVELSAKPCYEVTVVKRRLQESFFSRHGTFVFS